jgi:hypothetical protein
MQKYRPKPQQSDIKATLQEKHKGESRKQKPGLLVPSGLGRSGAPGLSTRQGMEAEAGGLAGFGVEFEGAVAAVFQEFDAG